MSKDTLEEIKERLDCLILLNCIGDSNEKLKIVVNCFGLRETARLMGKDHSNLSKSLKKKTEK